MTELAASVSDWLFIIGAELRTSRAFTRQNHHSNPHSVICLCCMHCWKTCCSPTHNSQAPWPSPDLRARWPRHSSTFHPPQPARPPPGRPSAANESMGFGVNSCYTNPPRPAGRQRLLYKSPAQGRESGLGPGIGPRFTANVQAPSSAPVLPATREVAGLTVAPFSGPKSGPNIAPRIWARKWDARWQSRQ